MSIGAKGAASAGLVEIELDGGNVVLTLHPPREKPVVLTMDPGEARALADGLMQAAEEAGPGAEAMTLAPDGIKRAMDLLSQKTIKCESPGCEGH